jgi:hypothetical protein
MKKKLLTGAILLLVSQISMAAEVSFLSPGQQVGMLELYTSEGCSSCPPADRWLSKLKDKDGLWDGFIPMAFHVDYWDYIGWKDRFASAAYSQRQRQYARERSVKTVYTPGFVYNGEEWRNWFNRRSLDFPNDKMPGVLQLDVDNQLATVRFKPSGNLKDHLHINVALLGFDIATKVKAGENRGRELKHDFVVLGMNKTRLEQVDGVYTGTIELPESNIQAPRYAVVGWVSNTHRQKPIQVVGGWLPE